MGWGGGVKETKHHLPLLQWRGADVVGKVVAMVLPCEGPGFVNYHHHLPPALSLPPPPPPPPSPSTGQAEGHDSDVLLKPVSMFRDPFFQGQSVLVMCETYDKDGQPHPTNKRHSCNKIMEK